MPSEQGVGLRHASSLHLASNRSDADQPLGLQLATAAAAARRVFSSQIARTYDVGPTEVAILRLLIGLPGIPASTLVELLGITPPGISVHVESLRRRGLVERRPSEKDRRARALYPTTLGANLASKVTQRHAEAEADAFNLSKAEREILGCLLSQINASPAARASAKPASWDDASR